MNKQIGERIKAIRNANDMTQTELGNILGVEKASISKYEAGDAKRGVPVGFLIKIAELGNTTVEKIITGKESGPITDRIDRITTGDLDINVTAENYRAQPDLGLVKQVIEAVEEHLQDNQLTMPPAKIAELITVLYEEALEASNQQVNKGTVSRMIKLAT